ncbi:MAG: ATP-binding protein [Pseudomonadota bacterium]
MIPRGTIALARRISIKYLAAVTITISVIFLAVFLWVSRQQEQHIMEQVQKQAVAVYTQIALTREWVAEHGTILVEKKAGVDSNPYLTDPDVRTADGRVYTRISPSMLTTQLSDRAAAGGNYFFRLSGPNYLNPRNAPDDTDRHALEEFRKGAVGGIFRVETFEGGSVLRYIAPVHMNESCMACHGSRPGYTEGESAGCLSVFVPLDDALAAIGHNKTILLVGMALFAGSSVLVLFVSTSALIFRPIKNIRTSIGEIYTKARNSSRPCAGAGEGDELGEIREYCYFLDEQLRNQHAELERNIGEATRDLSEANRRLETLNRELTALNAAKSDFFSDISHELRTPLTNIKGAADILARIGLEDKNGNYVDIIRRNADYLIKIVVDFLDYSRIEAGQPNLRLEKASLKEIAEEAVLAHQAQADARSLGLVLKADEDACAVFDKQRIFQVITNLISNALKFSPEHGEVAVEVTAANGTAGVCVSDNGPGIDPLYHQAVFQKFYQAPGPAGARLHKGSSGIGLAICKGIVEAHGGRIWVETAPGQGSKFRFSLPIQEC